MKERVAKNITKEVISAGQIDLTNPDDVVTQFVNSLEKSEENLKKPLAWELSHNRRRSAPNMKNATNERLEQLQDVRDALQILKDPDFKQAVFYKNEHGKIVGFKVEPNHKV